MAINTETHRGSPQASTLLKKQSIVSLRQRFTYAYPVLLFLLGSPALLIGLQQQQQHQKNIHFLESYQKLTETFLPLLDQQASLLHDTKQQYRLLLTNNTPENTAAIADLRKQSTHMTLLLFQAKLYLSSLSENSYLATSSNLLQLLQNDLQQLNTLQQEIEAVLAKIAYQQNNKQSLFLTSLQITQIIQEQLDKQHQHFKSVGQQTKNNLAKYLQQAMIQPNIFSFFITNQVLALLWILSYWFYQEIRQFLKRLKNLTQTDAKNCLYEEELFLKRQINQQQQKLLQIQTICNQLNKQLQLTRRQQSDFAFLKVQHNNLINSLRSSIWIIDSRQMILSSNHLAQKMFDNSTKNNISFLDHPIYKGLLQHRVNIKTTMQQAQEENKIIIYEAVEIKISKKTKKDLTEKIITATEQNITTTKQQTCFFNIAMIPNQDETAQARGLVIIADDVTEAVQTKYQLLKAERLASVGRLSAQVAHEIRNPLSAIALNAELLQEEIHEKLETNKSHPIDQLIKGIIREVDRLSDLTENYLSMAKPPSFQRRVLPIHTLIGDLSAMLREELTQLNIKMTLDLGSITDKVSMDAGQLHQALLNIIGNSRDAMPEGGELLIRTEKQDNLIKILIKDTGTGISPHCLPCIFEPFYTTKTKGTGLGLSLTKQIIEEHAGQLQITSKHQKGAEVILYLPIVADLFDLEKSVPNVSKSSKRPIELLL